MAVKSGYKQTDVGVIPEEWEARNIRDVCTLVNGRGFKPHEWQTTGLPIIRIQNLNGSDEFNFYSGQYNSKILIEPGQLLFAWSGSRGTSFGPHVWSGSRALLNYHTWKVVTNDSAADAGYLLHALRQLTRFIEDRAHGASALVHTQKWEMEKFPIPVPSNHLEQRAIATALGDMDALLNALERLIAKKRDLKQATMQQLLTGQARLPGFHGEREVKVLAEITDCLDNMRVPLNEAQRGKMQGDYPYCGANGVLDFVDGFVIDDDIILMAEDGGYFDEYKTRPIAYRMRGKCWVNNHAHILKAKPGVDQGFIFYSLVHKNILPYLASGTRAKLNKSEMNKIELQLPSDLLEQTAIAAVLTDMDDELAALEQRLAKTRVLKQGMMQELLTGRTRLV
ncbi:restriction endonuclease subunit S [Pseudomonas extremaustralis]|uniref:Restriction endonuclease subunit S n=1 Tax=Pseudomonas extremaustralis TaxID=359110 RepID=A0A5C5QH37_9PSED|nr:restriction endonuclease subunit S [Pseudomonas extremaustralis]TWS04614.1 restriction endonuclease subunit S [Pseudomonas extremaustralis]SDG30694.1 type I restriction enzyme, S subunit [Pseudomonas extremaustralis]